MAKYSTSITLDSDVVEKLRSHGINVSGFARSAINAFMSEGFDDYLSTLKIKMLEDNISALKGEYNQCKERLNYLSTRLKNLEDIYERTKEEHEHAMTVGRLSTLYQRINKSLVINSFNVEKVATEEHQTVAEILVINPQFNLSQHATHLRKIMNL